MKYSHFSLIIFHFNPNMFRISVAKGSDRLKSCSKMAKLQLLSPEILTNLFKHFPPDDLQKLRLVSKSWKELIEKDFGTAVLFSNDNWAWTCRSQGTRIGTFHSFTQKFPSSLPFILDLQEITFHRILVKNNLISILQKCSNIQKLSFSKIILDQSYRIVVPYVIRLPKLTVLQVNLPYGQNISEDYEVIMDFLADEVNMHNLKEFSFWCPNHELEKLSLGELCGFQVSGPSPSHISRSIVGLIRKYRGTIETARFGAWKSPVKFCFHDFLNGRFPEKPIQLQAVKATCEVPECWDPLLRTQHHLQGLRLERHAGNLWIASRKAITQSAELILEIILMDESAWTWDLERKEIDFSIFKDCWILTKLVLEFNTCFFTNPRQLPAALKILELKGYLSKEQFSIFPSILPNLKILKLDNCEKMKWGRKTEDDSATNATVDMDLFRKLVLKRNLMEISLENFSMTWSPIMNWCVVESSTEVTMEVWIQRFEGNPFAIRISVTGKGITNN